MGKKTDWENTNITEDKALGEVASDRIFEDDPELAKELAEDRKIQERARAYKELQDARKKEKRKRIITGLIVVMVLTIAVLTGIKVYRDKKSSQENANEIAITEAQELVYGEVSSVAGNNITIERVVENSEKSPGKGSMSTSSYTGTGETTQLQIPVGTEVITKLGTKATFTSISSGNVLAIALEKGTDIIDKVWIVE